MSLLDSADHTPDLAKKYETIQKRFSARLPIMQMVMRRQKIEYKLKMIQKIASSDQPQGHEEMTRAEAVAAKPVLLTELNELRNSIEVMIRDYESQYGEKFERARAGNQSQDSMQSPQQQQHSPTPRSAPLSSLSRPSQMSPSPPKQRPAPGQLQHGPSAGAGAGFSSQRSPAHQPRRTAPTHSHKSPTPPSMTNRY